MYFFHLEHNEKWITFYPKKPQKTPMDNKDNIFVQKKNPKKFRYKNIMKYHFVFIFLFFSLRRKMKMDNFG